MFKQKTYKGVKQGYSTTAVNISRVGVTTTVSSNVFFTDLFCTTLQAFLNNECGLLDCRYDAESKNFYILGVPLVFQCIVNSTNGAMVNIWAPFKSSAYNGYSASTNAPSFTYNQTTGEYSISFRFVGDPATDFCLLILAHIKYGSSASTGTILSAPVVLPAGLAFSRGKDLLRDKNFVAVAYSTYATTTPNYYEFDNGEVVNYNNLASGNSSFVTQGAISMSNVDKTDCPDKIFLKQKEVLYLRFDNLFYYPVNLGLPTPSGAIQNDQQTFVKINEELFWITPYANNTATCTLSGIVKCPTPG